MYIVKVSDIIDPLFVIDDVEKDTSTTNRMFCALPEYKWGKYFSRNIYNQT